MRCEVICADCLDAMRDMPEDSVDAIVTDPPYGLGFMGVAWDTFGDGRKGGARSSATFDQVGGNHHPTCAADQARTRRVENVKFQAAMAPIFAEALRVAKPGAHLLCFGGTRTFHRMACAIEDAGWEVRDCIMWVYGSGFPKSMNVGKALARAGKDAARWDGWGTCLKPAWEPIIVARKPLDGTVAHNVLTWGTGALNIDACRVPSEPHDSSRDGEASAQRSYRDSGSTDFANRPGPRGGDRRGRFPANLVHDGSQAVLDLFPESRGQLADRKAQAKPSVNAYGDYGVDSAFPKRGDSGSAARFFYCAKASKKDRGEGNDHPTCKPTALMEWLVRLVTPEGGVVLDPFCGSGTTLVACGRLGVGCVGIDREEHYCEIARARLGLPTTSDEEAS